MFKNACSIIFASSLCVLAAFGVSLSWCHNAPAIHAASLTVDDVLWWLPPDTKTLMVAQGPFRLDSIDPRTVNWRDLERVLQRMPLAHIAAWDTSFDLWPPELLQGAGIIFAVAGARNFRPPASLGGTRYEGCQIVLLSQSFGRRANRLMEVFEKVGRKVEIQGQVVVKLEREIEGDLGNFFVVRPRPNLFLVATDEKFLDEVLTRMRVRGSSRALPEELSEWKLVDRKARFWAIRHFDPQRTESDPTSPFNPHAAADFYDPQAVGLAFSYSLQPSMVPTVYYLSENSNAITVAKNFWLKPHERLYPVVQWHAKGVVEITVPRQGGSETHVFLFLLMGAFGHAVFL